MINHFSGHKYIPRQITSLGTGMWVGLVVSNSFVISVSRSTLVVIMGITRVELTAVLVAVVVAAAEVIMV